MFKPNNYRDVQNLYQDKASMDMTLNEFKTLTSTCWDKKQQPISIDKTQVKLTGRYRLCLNILIVPDCNLF